MYLSPNNRGNENERVFLKPATLDPSERAPIGSHRTVYYLTSLIPSTKRDFSVSRQTREFLLCLAACMRI